MGSGDILTYADWSQTRNATIYTIPTTNTTTYS